MKKQHYFLCLFLLFGIFSCAEQNPNKPIQNQNIITVQTESGAKTEVYRDKLEDEKKVQLARERIKEITSIRKGDYMMVKNNPQNALAYYLPLLTKLPDDIVLHRKIANAYFLLKEWKNAYKHFVFVPILDLSKTEQQNMIFSLLYDEDFTEHKAELSKFRFTKEQKEYYDIIAECYFGIDKCADVIWNYEGTDEKILSLKKIITDSYKVSPDIQYRNLLLAKELYEQKMYRLVGMFTSEILANKNSYQEAHKMRAFALYELGKYSDAKEKLLSYFNNHPNDMEVIIRLGETFTFLGDYTTANLYFNNAILAGYLPKTLLERRLAYNYAKIGDKEGMKKVLSYLLQEDDVTEDDFAVAISLAFDQNEYIRAYSWAHEGNKKFPKSKILAPLYMQSLRMAQKIPEALQYFNEIPEELQKLPIVQLERGIIFLEQDDFVSARQIFEGLITYNEDADFSIEAKKYLEILRQKEEAKQRQEEIERQKGEAFSGGYYTDDSSNFWDS